MTRSNDVSAEQLEYAPPDKRTVDAKIVRRTFVRCIACRIRSSAIVRPDGTYRLPTIDGRCRCGCDRFIELDGLMAE